MSKPAVGLFIPCYVDQMFPQVGIATVGLLRRLKVEFEFPAEQTCCGQPMANIGCAEQARPLAIKFFQIFKDFDYIVCPSGSCAAMVRNHYGQYLQGLNGGNVLRQRTYELCEYLVDVLGVRELDVCFPYKVALHQSCHGLRELRLASSSEISGGGRESDTLDKTRFLLKMVKDIELVTPKRADECCGFGGTFAVTEESVSVMMGSDRIADFESAGAQVITATDMSCLAHLDGLIRRENKALYVKHIAEILCGGDLKSTDLKA